MTLQLTINAHYSLVSTWSLVVINCRHSRSMSRLPIGPLNTRHPLTSFVQITCAPDPHHTLEWLDNHRPSLYQLIVPSFTKVRLRVSAYGPDLLIKSRSASGHITFPFFATNFEFYEYLENTFNLISIISQYFYI